MELKIYWTDFAKNELQNIFLYYKNVANIKTANKITIKIVKQVRILKMHPKIGQVEYLLENRNEEFRYLLVEKKFKIIYLVNLEKDRIEIVDIFDTRQNPSKMIKER